MIKLSETRRILDKYILNIYLLIASLEGIVATIFLVQSPSEAGQSLIFGLSAQRFVLALLNVGLFLFLLIAVIYFWKHPRITEQLKLRLAQQKTSSVFLVVSTIMGVIFISLAFLIPEYRFSSFAGYIERLRPTILWFALLSVQTIFLLLLISTPKTQKIRHKKTILVFFIFLIFLWIFIAWSGLGIDPDDRFWNEAGVPLLNEQVFIALTLSLVLFFFSFTMKKVQTHPFLAFIHKKQDTLIFIILWGITAFLWTIEPFPDNFFAPGPYPPNNQLSPYADAAAFDIGAQFSLIGQGLFNNDFYARAFLSGFLAILHIIVGQNYLTVVTLQTAIFASLVPILYLIGKELHSRVAGILISILLIFKGINAIASSALFLSSHPKYMLTEFPTGIMLALFTLWLLKWQKEGAQKEYLLILSGGVLGLGIMLRTNILFFLPFAIFLFFLLDWRKILHAASVFTLAFFITISPWMWRSQKVANKPLFFLDILTEVIRTRYLLETTNFGMDEKSEVRAPAPEAERSGVNLDVIPANQQIVRRETTPINPHPRLLLQEKIAPQKNSMLEFIPNHFFHNIVTSTLILPTSPIFHDLRHTIKDIYPYWNKIDKKQWQGQLTLGAKIMLLWNFFLLALGLSISWKKWHIAGLIPLFVFFTYHVSNAFARTSGGRYLVPVDWVVLLYYALGIVEIIYFIAPIFGFDIKNKGKEENLSKNNSISYPRGFFHILPFFLVVLSITVVDKVIPQRYPKQTKDEVAAQVIKGGWLEETSISAQELNTFLQQPDSRAFFGRNLYPRFYYIGKGEQATGRDAYDNKDFPRLSFTMIGPFGQTGAVLPLTSPPIYFPNAVDTILIGCQHPDKGYMSPYIDALIVIVLGEDETALYTREPEALLECPLPDPVCDGNRNCK